MKIRFERVNHKKALGDLRPGDVFGYGTLHGGSGDHPQGRPMWAVVVYPAGEGYFLSGGTSNPPEYVWACELDDGRLRRFAATMEVVIPLDAVLTFRGDDGRRS